MLFAVAMIASSADLGFQPSIFLAFALLQAVFWPKNVTSIRKSLTNNARNFAKIFGISVITTAMLQKLTKEKLSALTVSQVYKRAGVSRMAFYRNFEGLEQILYEYYQPKIAAVFDVISQNTQEADKYNSQFNFFNTFGDAFLSSVDRGFEPVIQRIFIEEIKKFYAQNNDDYWTTFMSAGVYAIWRKWLLDGQQKPLKEVMEFLKQFDTIRGLPVYSQSQE